MNDATFHDRCGAHIHTTKWSSLILYIFFFKHLLHYLYCYWIYSTLWFHITVLIWDCCYQIQSTPGLCSRPGSPCFQPGSVRNNTEIVSPAACCVPGACPSATVWTAARVTVGVHWFARGMGAGGCWLESSPGVMVVVTPLFLGCTHVLAGSCDGLTRSSTNPTRTNDGE